MNPTTDQQPHRSEIRLVHEEVKAVGRDVEEIKVAITGNTRLGIQGLVKRVDLSEKDIYSLKKWRENITLKVAYTAGIVSGLTFWGSEGIKTLVTKIFHHP